MAGSRNELVYKPICLLLVTLILNGNANHQNGLSSNDQVKNKDDVGWIEGIKFGDTCYDSVNCVTDRAVCLNGICTCPQNNIVLWIAESGTEVCRERIYKLYDPCEFSEQCIHLLDKNSFCGPNGICTCAPWATDVNGKCVSKSEITYGRSQEMYRVGLIAVTCIIIVVVAVSLWVTLRRSCQEQNSVRQRSSLNNDCNPGDATFSTASIQDVTSDKPPSYSDVQGTGDMVGASPPDFKDALMHSITAKKLLRQVSAPAGQLLSKTPTINAKTGCDSPVFSHDES